MATNKRNDGINLSVRAKDNRYKIPVYLDDGESPAFILHFNPGDPFVLGYVDALRNLDMPDSKADDSDSDTGEFLSVTEKIEKNLDAIFGDSAARLICRYNGAEHALLHALLEKVRAGYDDFQEKAKEAERAAKAQAVIDAKKQAAPYIAPV